MTDIRIPLPLVPLAVTAATAAAIAVQLPEIKRYLRIRSMG
jgi:hypothetical protein